MLGREWEAVSILRKWKEETIQTERFINLSLLIKFVSVLLSKQRLTFTHTVVPRKITRLLPGIASCFHYFKRTKLKNIQVMSLFTYAMAR